MDLMLQPIPGGRNGNQLYKLIAPGAAFQLLDGPRPSAARPAAALSKPTRQAKAPAAKPQSAAATDFEKDCLRFRAKLIKFVAAFGPRCGAEYAAAGLSFDQAQARHAQFVEGVRRFGELMDQKDAHQAKLKKLTNALGSNLAKAAAAIKLPGKAA